MGNRVSRAGYGFSTENQQVQAEELINLERVDAVPNAEVLESNLYFGPKFLLDFSQHPAYDSGLSRNEIARIFWDEIWSLFSGNGGLMTESQMAQYGNLYQQSTISCQQTAVIESRVNLIKNSIEVRKRSSDQFSVSFTFDSSETCMIHFYWIASEHINWSDDVIKSIDYKSKESEGNMHWTFGPFTPALQQTFDLPDSHLLDLSVINFKDLEVDDDISREEEIDSLQSPENGEPKDNQISDGEKKQIFPLIIVLETIGSGIPSEDLSHVSSNQMTYVRFKLKDEGMIPKVIKQKMIIDGVPYILQDIYGFPDGGTNDPVNNDDLKSMRECVICMSAPKDTIAIPCRHLCVCKDCADILRQPPTSQPSPPKCPICRQVLHSLLQISLPKEFRKEASKASLNTGILKTAPIIEKDVPEIPCSSNATEGDYILGNSNVNEDNYDKIVWRRL